MSKICKLLLINFVFGFLIFAAYGCQQKSDFKVKVAGVAEKDSGKGNTPSEKVKVLSVTASNPDGTYTSGEVILIEVTFSADVGVQNESDITLALAVAAEPRSAAYSTGTGSPVLVFSYQVQPEDYSKNLQYTGTDALQLGATGMIADAGGVPADLTLPALSSGDSLASKKKIVIDARSPKEEQFDKKLSFEYQVYQTTSIKRLIVTPANLDADADATGLTLSFSGQNFTCSIVNDYATDLIPAASKMTGLVMDDQNAINTMLSGLTYGKENEVKIKYVVGGDTRADSKATVTVEDFYIAGSSMTGFADGSLQKDGFIGWLNPMHQVAAGPNISYDADNKVILSTNMYDILLQ